MAMLLSIIVSYAPVLSKIRPSRGAGYNNRRPMSVSCSLQKGGASAEATVLQWTHWDMSMEITWRTSTTRVEQTIFSVTSTRIYYYIAVRSMTRCH